MLTVLMATHNGADTLPEVFAAYCKLEAPSGGWKLVIVDNASSDTTKQLIDSASSRLPITYHFEPKAGKNRALNSGLHLVEGDVVVFTDDDAIPSADWLVQARILADSQPSFGVFGGAIVPHWEVPPPNWILPFQCPILGVTDPGWDEGPTLPGRIWGPNMMIRAEAFKIGHRFNEALGPTGLRYQMGDETEFVDRLVAAGFKVWHTKKMVVAHMIRSDQMRKNWILQRALASGRVAYRRNFLASPAPITLLLGFPRYLIRQLVEQALQTAWSGSFGDELAAFKNRVRLSFLIGQAIEGRIFHKSLAFEGHAVHGDRPWSASGGG
jgi:glycosyltransferase involved in cell wall biosynthesis